MKNKFEPFSQIFWVVVVATYVTGQIIGHYIELSPVGCGNFAGLLVGAVGLLYGVVYYLVKRIINWIKMTND